VAPLSTLLARRDLTAQDRSSGRVEVISAS